MIRSWRCRQLAAALVDYADGVLGVADRARVERHLADCASCAATAASLREVPALLRGDSGAHDDAFWIAQRQRIMQEIDDPSPRAGEPLRGFDWRLPLPVAAAAVIALAGYLSLRAPSAPGAVVLDALSPDDLVALVEVAGDIVPAQELLPDSAVGAQAALSGALEAGWIRTDDASGLEDLDDEDRKELHGTSG